ncbi:MAG: Maf-like protein [Candidatus Omnitrophica bacterium]|nr:Maf-like protein [Candidatus Omnitrophota bacterium]
MLYLASRSPRRRALLRQLGRPFRVVRSAHRETIRRNESPSANAMRNAVGKARCAKLPLRASGIVIGADTFLYFQGRVIGKPSTMRAAFRLLKKLSGNSHWVYTGLCLLDPGTGRMRAAYEKTQVTFQPMTRGAIQRLFARSSPLDKAGGYALQACLPRRARRRQADRGELIARIAGSRSNVIGLPLELLRRELAAMKSY